MISNISNPVLLNAIEQYRKDKSQKPLVFEALYDSVLLCPVRIDDTDVSLDADGCIIPTESTPFEIVGIADTAGAQYLMAFTDWNELMKWNQWDAHQIIALDFTEYVKLLLADHLPYQGVVINHFSDNFLLGKQLFINNPLSAMLTTSETILIDHPKEYPKKLVKKLRQYFHRTKLVDSAYMLWMDNGEEAGYLLVVGTTFSPRILFPEICDLCKPFLEDKSLDIVQLRSVFGQKAVDGQNPFYVAYNRSLEAEQDAAMAASI